jgi:restriction system protein
MNKRRGLLLLAQKRKAARWPGYSQIGDYHNCAYECDFVSPYTKTAGNVDANIMVMLQDWSSAKSLRDDPLDRDSVDYGFTRTFPTNRRLTELLHLHFGVGFENIYATNLFPFIKPGGISNYIPMRDLIRAAQEFALPQVRIVQPRLVICLGLNTFNALRVACNHLRVRRMHDAIASPFTVDRAHVWCQAHTGARGQSNRGRKRVNQDWRTMALAFSGGAEQIVGRERRERASQLDSSGDA